MPLKITLSLIGLFTTFSLAQASTELCLEAARNAGWNEEAQRRLCEGAESLAPVACAEAARIAGWNEISQIQLCRKATSNSPVSCTEAARASGWSEDAQVRLCASRL